MEIKIDRQKTAMFNLNTSAIGMVLSLLYIIGVIAQSM